MKKSSLAFTLGAFLIGASPFVSAEYPLVDSQFDMDVHFLIESAEDDSDACWVDEVPNISFGLTQLGWQESRDLLRVRCPDYINDRFHLFFQEGEHAGDNGSFYSDEYVDIFVGAEDAHYTGGIYFAGWPDNPYNPTECIHSSTSGPFSNKVQVEGSVSSIYAIGGKTSSDVSKNYNSCIKNNRHIFESHSVSLYTFINVKALPTDEADAHISVDLPITFLVEP